MARRRYYNSDEIVSVVIYNDKDGNTGVSVGKNFYYNPTEASKKRLYNLVNHCEKTSTHIGDNGALLVDIVRQ